MTLSSTIHFLNTKINSIVAIFMVTIFFSCTNSPKQVKDLLTDKNLPIGEAKNAYHVYKDSGRITSKLITPLMYDFSNRETHPYAEFPKGIKIVSIGKSGKDSTTVIGNYAISYNKTSIAEIKGNVVVVNHSNMSRLETNQIFWDQKEKYFFSEEKFKLTTPNDTINGFGFESAENLTKWIAKDITGNIETKEEH